MKIHIKKLIILILILILNCSLTFSQKYIAITIDDAPLAGQEFSLNRTIKMNQRFISLLNQEKVPATIFVNERKINVKGEIDQRKEILDMWLEAGFELGNHTYSHKNFFNTSLLEFKIELMKGEILSKLSAKEYNKKIEFFRHPYLNTGSSLEIKQDFENFLAENDYKIAPVTMESSDYIFNEIYVKAKREKDSLKMKKVVEYYVTYSNQMIDYFDSLAIKKLNKSIKHIFLCHDNELNSDHFTKILKLMRDKGFEFISLKNALDDKIYQSEDNYISKMGISWIYRWLYAKEQSPEGKKAIMDLIRAEPEPEKTIMEEYNKK